MDKINGDGVLKMIAASGWSLCAGLLLAWYTAMSQKGVTQEQLQNYVKEYSPYTLDRAALNEHQIQQDQAIGKVQGVVDKNSDKINSIILKQETHDKDIVDLNRRLTTLGDWLDGIRKEKK